MTDAFDFSRYLASKRTVDDRALNRQVWQTLADAVVAELPPDRPLRVLEVGAGIGTMVERCVEWGLFTDSGFCIGSQAGGADAFAVDYTAIDSEESNIEVARRQLAHLTSGGESGLRVRLQTANLYEFAARRENRHRFDLIVAHALLDLLHLPTALPILLQMVRPAGLFYFSINFDGATLFVPEVDRGAGWPDRSALSPLDGHAHDGWAAVRRQPHGTQAFPRFAGERGGGSGGRQLRLGRASGGRGLSC